MDGVEVKLHSLLGSTIDGDEWLFRDLGCFIPGQRTLDSCRLGNVLQHESF
jgi:hypothetical protein